MALMENFQCFSFYYIYLSVIFQKILFHNHEMNDILDDGGGGDAGEDKNRGQNLQNASKQKYNVNMNLYP